MVVFCVTVSLAPLVLASRTAAPWNGPGNVQFQFAPRDVGQTRVVVVAGQRDQTAADLAQAARAGDGNGVRARARALDGDGRGRAASYRHPGTGRFGARGFQGQPVTLVVDRAGKSQGGPGRGRGAGRAQGRLGQDLAVVIEIDIPGPDVIAAQRMEQAAVQRQAFGGRDVKAARDRELQCAAAVDGGVARGAPGAVPSAFAWLIRRMPPLMVVWPL